MRACMIGFARQSTQRQVGRVRWCRADKACMVSLSHETKTKHTVAMPAACRCLGKVLHCKQQPAVNFTHGSESNTHNQHCCEVALSTTRMYQVLCRRIAMRTHQLAAIQITHWKKPVSSSCLR
jgi:hypothetical protein